VWHVLLIVIPRWVPPRAHSLQPAQLNAIARQTSMEMPLKDSNVSLVLGAVSFANKRLLTVPLLLLIAYALRILMAHSQPAPTTPPPRHRTRLMDALLAIWVVTPELPRPLMTEQTKKLKLHANVLLVPTCRRESWTPQEPSLLLASA